jgi:hypothetical protein
LPLELTAEAYRAGDIVNMVDRAAVLTSQGRLSPFKTTKPSHLHCFEWRRCIRLDLTHISVNIILREQVVYRQGAAIIGRQLNEGAFVGSSLQADVTLSLSPPFIHLASYDMLTPQSPPRLLTIYTGYPHARSRALFNSKQLSRSIRVGTNLRSLCNYGPQC